MPVDSELIGQVEALEGGAELAKTLREKWGADATALDTATGETRTLKASLKTATTERDKFASDLETAGKDRDEQLTKLTSERDAAIGERDTARGELTSFQTRTLVRGALREAGVTDKTALGDAVALFMASAPEGMAIEDGKLSGADKALKEFLEARPHLVAKTSGDGGGRQGGDPNPKGKGGKPTAREKTDKWRARLGGKPRAQA